MNRRVGYGLGAVGLFLLAAFFFLGVALYGGLWYCYVGSVVDFINQCKAPVTDSWAIAGDLFCFFVGGTVCLVVGIWGGIFSGGGAFYCLSQTGPPKAKSPGLPVLR